MTFAQFADAFHDHFTQNPNARVMLGVDRDLGQLPDPSFAAISATIARAVGLLATLGAMDLSEADFDTALDADLAKLTLEAQVERLSRKLDGAPELSRKPTAGDDIGDPLFMMLITDPRPAAQRLEDMTSRIEQVPDYLTAMVGRLEQPLARWAQIEHQKVEGLPSLFDTIHSWAVHEGWSGADRLKQACATAGDALSSYDKALAAMPTTTCVHLGPEATDRIVALRGVELSKTQLHGIATEFLANTHEQLVALAAKLLPKYDLPAETSLAELHHFLNERFKVQLKDGELDSVLDHYRASNQAILEFVEERQLFPILEDQEMRILRTPSFLESSIPAGAMAPPAAFREGTRVSIVYLTLHADQLDDHTALGIPTMMIHEGIPGHHLQLATAAGHGSIIRRHTDSPDLAEGWTTMLEDYMLDLGFMGDLTDEARFIGKRDISRIGARVAIDLFFMSGDKGFLDVGVPCDLSSDDPFEAAGSLLRAVTGFSEGRANAELNWYSMERGYPLSYLTGNHLVWGMKRENIAAQGPDADETAVARRFHEVYLNAGNMPLAFLRRVFEHEGLL